MSDLDEAIKTELDSIKGLAIQATELDMVISPEGPHKGDLVCVVKHHGAHVCWGCMELFGAPYSDLGPTEVVPFGGTVPVLLHRKCVDPKNRKVFSDMGGSRRLQTVEEVSKGFRVRRAMAQAVKPFLAAASSAANKLIVGG